MTDNTEHRVLDKLARDMTISIDTEVLYKAMGWTIVRTQNPLLDTVSEWLNSYGGEYYYWDGQIAFKQAESATMFILKWK